MPTSECLNCRVHQLPNHEFTSLRQTSSLSTVVTIVEAAPGRRLLEQSLRESCTVIALTFREFQNQTIHTFANTFKRGNVVLRGLANS
jgi:hypothetical protein